jgi:23S rRNA (cytosine1962-C5)-methyltransferase
MCAIAVRPISRWIEITRSTVLRRVEPRGVLVTFSCSGRVGETDFQTAVARGASDAGRSLRILERLAQSPDHPVSASCPESGYLKGFVCEAD